MNMKGNCFELIPNMKVTTTVQLITHCRGLQDASESAKNREITVLEARNNVLKGTNGNASFTMIFFNLYFHCIFYHNAYIP